MRNYIYKYDLFVASCLHQNHHIGQHQGGSPSKTHTYIHIRAQRVEQFQLNENSCMSRSHLGGAIVSTYV